MRCRRINVVANGGCWNGQSVMVSADTAVFGWSAGSGGYIIVRRGSAQDDDAQGIDWQGDGSLAIGSAQNVGGSWWNTLVADPLLPPADLASQTGLSLKRLN